MTTLENTVLERGHHKQRNELNQRKKLYLCFLYSQLFIFILKYFILALLGYSSRQKNYLSVRCKKGPQLEVCLSKCN